MYSPRQALIVCCIAVTAIAAPYKSSYDKLSSVQTARKQFKRLFFNPHSDRSDLTATTTSSISNNSAATESASAVSYESIARIACSWLLLFLAKTVSLSSPLYFKSLIAKASLLDGYSSRDRSNSAREAMKAAIVGCIFGYSSSKLISGAVLLLSELLLFPVTLNAAMALPLQTFNAAIYSASRRWMGGAEGGEQSRPSERGYSARRVLDRGLRASNQCLYRSIFNLLPAAVELLSIIALTYFKAGAKVSIACAVFASLFIYTTGSIMRSRVVTLREQLQCESAANIVAEDALSLAETVAAYSNFEEENLKYKLALKRVQTSSNEVRKSFSYLKLVQTLLLSVGSLAVTYLTWRTSQDDFAYRLHDSTSSDGSMGAGASQIVLSTALFSQLCAPLEHLGQHFRDFVGSLEDLRELELLLASTDARAAVVSAPAPSATFNASLSEGAETPLMEIRNVTYSLRDKQLLCNISITVSATSSNGRGHSIAIVGPSGAGKSTLLRLLIGTLPVDAPHASLDGQLFIGGEDVTFRDRHACFCVVNQESSLFRTLSIESNILYGIESFIGSAVGAARAADSTRALDRAMLDAGLNRTLIATLSNHNLPTDNSDTDDELTATCTLSGGERQRVAIARALYHQQMRGGILIMDEMTSSLDASSEQAVIKAVLRRVSSDGISAVMITHNLNIARDCDEIIVVRNGAVVERGSHSELMKGKGGGWYRENFSLQRHHDNTF